MIKPKTRPWRPCFRSSKTVNQKVFVDQKFVTRVSGEQSYWNLETVATRAGISRPKSLALSCPGIGSANLTSAAGNYPDPSKAI